MDFTMRREVEGDQWTVQPMLNLLDYMYEGNEDSYVFQHYRPHLGSLLLCFKSIFRVHNETGSIWAHLIGFLFHLCLAFSFFSKPMVPLEAKVVFGIFFASILFCLSMSCLFHILNCHSPKVKKLFRKMDYCGYFVLFTGSCLSWIYYAFYNRVIIMAAYVLLQGLIAMFVTVRYFKKLRRFFDDPERPLRTLMLIFPVALGAVVPTYHFLMTEGFKHPLYIKSFCALHLSEFLYLLGGALNALRLPERYSAGTFDLVFHSHQIFHILIVVASYFHYCALCSIIFIV